MVCRVCTDKAICRQEKDCRAAPQSIATHPVGPSPNPLIVVNHAAEDAAPALGAPRE